MARLRSYVPAIVAALVALAFGALLLSTCGDPEARTLPPASSTSSTDAASVTTEPDFSRVALPELDGTTSTTAPRTSGLATLRGHVEGPDGAVPGAVVRAERLVGDVVQPFEVRTDADGRFELAGVPGGRFRVRAYLTPSLTMTEPEIFYQPDFETRDLRLRVEPFTGTVVRASTTPASPIVGDGVNLAVRVAERQVDERGIGREVPLAGVVVRVDANGWTSLDRSNRMLTQADGVAVFQYRCDRTGPVSATAIVERSASGTSTGAAPPPSDQVFPLDVPGCAPVPTTTTNTTTTTTAIDDQETTTSTSTTR